MHLGVVVPAITTTGLGIVIVNDGFIAISVLIVVVVTSAVIVNAVVPNIYCTRMDVFVFIIAVCATCINRVEPVFINVSYGASKRGMEI